MPHGLQGATGAERVALRLAELLTARLCHEVAGPLGTIMGSLELAAEEPEGSAEALAIANDAAGALASRIRLLRAAWGAGDGPLDPSGLRTLAAGLPGRGVRLALDALVPAPAASAPARVLLNLLLLGAESLPRGGALALSGDPRKEVLITIEGRDAAWPTGLAAALVDEAQAWSSLGMADLSGARTIQGPLTALIAHASGLRLSFLMAGAAPANAPLLLRCTPDV